MSFEGEITPEELAAIEERCRHASPGPWTSYIEGRDQSSGSSFILTGPDGSGDDIEIAGIPANDQDFIAHARRDVPSLLAEVRRLRAILADRGGG